MGKRFGSLSLGVLIVLLSAGLVQAEGFSGAIHFRNGQSVAFNHLGTDEEVEEYHIYGNLGAQNVRYPLSELKEIIFSEASKKYGSTTHEKSYGDAIVINSDGERFNLTEVFIKTRRRPSGRVYYVYNDPVTKALTATHADVENNISHISVGEYSGELKLNPETGEYFPALYNYDPFTGEKLIWAEEK